MSSAGIAPLDDTLSALDFVIATPMGIMDGLANTGTQLLEPILTFRISAPDDSAG